MVYNPNMENWSHDIGYKKTQTGRSKSTHQEHLFNNQSFLGYWSPPLFWLPPYLIQGCDWKEKDYASLS